MKRRLSAAQRRALQTLDLGIHRQIGDLRGVAERTLDSLCARQPALVRRVDLKPPTIYQTAYHRFYLLTPAGADARAPA